MSASSRPVLAAAGTLAGMALVLGVSLAAGAGEPAGPGGSVGSAQLASQTCVVSGPVQGLSPAQATNAGVVASAAMAASHEDPRAVRIALMTAITESNLRNLGPRRGNAGSLGLFQQRPSQGWGTPAQIGDPIYATDTFVKRLLALPGWSTMAPWAAAQAVQRSAFANGSNYKANWARAGAVAAAVLANGNTSGTCGQGASGLAGPTSGHGLPAGYVIPPGTPPKHAAVVAFALAQLGKPYVWGAAGPSAFDCSGLTMAAWASVGVHLLHYTGDQQHEGRAVSTSSLVPGDLVLTPGSDPPAPGVAGHVGIYLGDALVLSAIDPAQGVAVQSWSSFVSGGLVALRDPAPGQ